MARQAKTVVILTESAKFGLQGVVPLLPLEKVSMVITDDGIPDDIARYLTDCGIKVIKV
jgi:DeoR family ulaG and ulaABCDEF operon transcriptional repressor